MLASISNRVAPASEHSRTQSDSLVREGEPCGPLGANAAPVVGDHTRQQLFDCISEIQMQQKQVKQQLESYVNEQQQHTRTTCWSNCGCRITRAIRDSVVSKIMWQLILSSSSAVLIAWLHEHELVPSIESTAHETVGIVLGFLLGFRTESSSKRYEDGTQRVAIMHRSMREFSQIACSAIHPPSGASDELDSAWREVLWLELAGDWDSTCDEAARVWMTDDQALQLLAQQPIKSRACWKVTFRLLRLTSLLFGVACRDLQKGVMDGNDLGGHLEDSYGLCRMTRSEKRVLQGCNRFGEDRGLMRTRLVREWLEQTVESASQATIMSRSAVDKLLAGLRDFDEAFNLARMLTYSEPAAEYQHVYMILVIIFCFTCPFAMVENLSYMVVIPALTISFAFFGLEQLARQMDKPFGFDYSDLKVHATLEQLHKEIQAAIVLTLNGEINVSTDSDEGLMKALTSMRDRHPEEHRPQYCGRKENTTTILTVSREGSCDSLTLPSLSKAGADLGL